MTQLERIKGLLPVEVTAAFIAIQTLLNGDEVPLPGAGHVGANDHQLLMGVVIFGLIIANAALLYRGGQKEWTAIAFSTLGFLIWVLNVDETRWQDYVSWLGLSPSTTVFLLPILAIFYSLAAAVIATSDKNILGQST